MTGQAGIEDLQPPSLEGCTLPEAGPGRCETCRWWKAEPRKYKRTEHRPPTEEEMRDHRWPSTACICDFSKFKEDAGDCHLVPTLKMKVAADFCGQWASKP